MSRQLRNFNPIENKTIGLSGTSAASTTFSTKIGDPAKLPSSITVYNATTVVIFVAWGVATATADANGYAVGPGYKEIIDIGAVNDTVSVFPVSTVTGNVYVSRGMGS